jgi:hypothetical protein
MGVEYVIFGHSERRCLFEETDQDINAKLHLCLKQPGLQVISCVGETDEEYESELLASVCDCQIKKGLKDVTAADLERIVIAYESIWAIGTGKVATPQQAQIAHVTVRKSLSDMYGHEAAAQVRIQYGGSVKAENVDELMAMPDVDGALVGGASLDADSFTRIVDGASSSNSISQSSSRPKELTARLCVSTKNVLGESPVWSVKDQALYWISAPEEEVWNLGLCSAPCKRHGRLFGISGGTGLFGIDNSNNENQRATENEIDDTQTDPTRMLLLQQEGLLDRINRSKLDRINRSLRFRWFGKEISFFWHGNHICRCVLSQERQRRQAINAEGVVQCLVVKISLDALLLHTFIQRTAVLDKIHDGQRIPTRGRQTRDSQLVHGAKSRTAGNAFGKQLAQVARHVVSHDNFGLSKKPEDFRWSRLYIAKHEGHAGILQHVRGRFGATAGEIRVGDRLGVEYDTTLTLGAHGNMVIRRKRSRRNKENLLLGDKGSFLVANLG